MNPINSLKNYIRKKQDLQSQKNSDFQQKLKTFIESRTENLPVNATILIAKNSGNYFVLYFLFFQSCILLMSALFYLLNYLNPGLQLHQSSLINIAFLTLISFAIIHKTQLSSSHDLSFGFIINFFKQFSFIQKYIDENCYSKAVVSCIHQKNFSNTDKFVFFYFSEFEKKANLLSFPEELISKESYDEINHSLRTLEKNYNPQNPMQSLEVSLEEIFQNLTKLEQLELKPTNDLINNKTPEPQVVLKGSPDGKHFEVFLMKGKKDIN